MPALADKLAASLTARDAANGKTYQQRADDFKASMKPVLDEIKRLKMGSSGRTVTATEPVFGYMAKALDFKMVNDDFQIAVMNDTEPTADETAAFEKSLTSHEAEILFYNSQVTDPTTERLKKIAEKEGVPIVGVTETQPPGAKNYVEWVLGELHDVEAGLAGKAR
jgi:zinc/manganese transport system substrate-binding protein